MSATENYESPQYGTTAGQDLTGRVDRGSRREDGENDTVRGLRSYCRAAGEALSYELDSPALGPGGGMADALA